MNDTGYPFYPHALSIRAADKDKLAPCLRRLVPIVQRAQIDFLNHPDRTNAFIVHLVAKYHDPSWTYPPGLADYAITQLRLNFVNNGADQSWATSRPTGSSTWSTSSRRSWPASASPTSRASSPRTCTPTSTSTPASACRRPDRRGRGGG